jgi:hypothetical protein
MESMQNFILVFPFEFHIMNKIIIYWLPKRWKLVGDDSFVLLLDIR